MRGIDRGGYIQLIDFCIRTQYKPVDESLQQTLRQQALDVHIMLSQLQKEFAEEDNQTYCILCKNWFEQWKLYVNYEKVINNQSGPNTSRQSRPAIFNWHLIDQGAKMFFKYKPFDKHHWNKFLKPNLIEGRDYIVISKELSSYLEQYYGGINIERNTKGKGLEKQVDIYFLKFQLVMITQKIVRDIVQGKYNEKNKEYMQVDENVNLLDYYNIIKETLPSFSYGEYKSFRLWRYTKDTDPQQALFDEIKQQVKDTGDSQNLYFNFSGVPFKISSEITFKSLNYNDNDVIVIELQQLQKPWCIRHPSFPIEEKCEGCWNYAVPYSICNCKKVSYCSEQCKSREEDYHLQSCDALGSEDEWVKLRNFTESSVYGVAGLKNLGNTGYMNAGIQCLSNTYPLTEYFLSNKYFEEISVTNHIVIGPKGKLVRKYASLIKNLWCSDRNILNPHSFKIVLGQYIKGFQYDKQHDASQFILYFLNDLHEELNRIKYRPQWKQVEYQRKPDDEMAKERWEQFLSTNQSIIIDLMYGQYKSIWKCPNCQDIKIDFNPFLNVDLVITNKQKKSIQIKVIKSVVSIEIKEIMLNDSNKHLSLQDFINESVIKQFNIDPDSELFYYISVMNDVSDPINTEQNIDKVRKNSKNGYLVVKVLTQDERKIDKNDRVYLSYVQKAYDSEGNNEQQIQSQTYLILSKEYSLVEIHLKIFQSLFPIFSDFVNLNELSTDEKLVEYYEQNILEIYYTLYSLKSIMQKKCFFCQTQNCQNCELRFTIKDRFVQQKQMNDMMQKIELIVFWNKGPFQAQLIKKSQLTVKLQECLRYSSQPQYQTIDDVLYCNVCKDSRQICITRQIYKAPEILIFVLKRFSKNSNKKSLNLLFALYRCLQDIQLDMKLLDIFVDFPIKGLDMTEFILNKNKPNENFEIQEKRKILYDLYAVINYQLYVDGGHYAAIAKNHHNGQWYYFNDSEVTQLNEDEIVTKKAYVLFYQRRNEQKQN